MTTMTLNEVTLAAFADELEKIALNKQAVDPVTLAGGLAAGKIMLSNTIARHAASIKPLRWLGQEVAGIGARTAMQGKPMLSRPVREVMATTLDPKLVGLYENAHAAGSMGGKGLQNAKQLASHLSSMPEAKNSPSLLRASEFVQGIPLESKGFRKVIDYGFTPVGQVGRDIKSGLGRLFGRKPVPGPVAMGTPTAASAVPVVQQTKTAFVKTELQPHQQRVVDKIQQADQPGLVVAHGLGSGKTLTSIAAQEALNTPADVVVPAALQGNYNKEVKKHVSGKTPKREIQSMQNMAVKGQGPANKMLIVDEAHRARDPASKTYKSLAKNKAEKRLLLTGSPFYNHPADIAPLVNLAAGDKVLPANPTDFERDYVRMAKINPGLLASMRGVKPGVVPELNKKKEKELRKIFGKWVDYHPGSTEEFPEVTREDVKVEMSPEQLGMYETVLGRAPAWVSYKIRKGMPPSKQEAKQLNAYLSGVRQVSNSTSPFQEKGDPHDPKIQKAFENLKSYLDQNPRAKAVVYSNYLDAGIAPYKRRLEEAKIPYGEFTGEMPKDKRDELVKQYNANKLKALLLSSAGGEGLDLQGTRLIQMLEPHWNDEKLKQVEGRGIRFRSHADLPPEERKVLVQRYLSTRPKSGIMEKLKLKKPGGAVDEYLAERSADKEKLIKQFRDLLAQEQPNEVPQT